MALVGQAVSEKKIFEIVDGRTDEGRTPDHGHLISSPCEPNGSGELIKAVRHNAPLSLLYEDGHPRCKGFRFGVKCAVRSKSGQIVYSLHIGLIEFNKLTFIRPVYNYDFRVSAIPVCCAKYVVVFGHETTFEVKYLSFFF